MIGWLLGGVLALAAEEDILGHRELGGHDFGQPVAVEPTLLTSFVSFRQGVGSLALRGVRYEGIPKPLSLQLLGLTESLRAQVRLTERVAVYGVASGAVLAGTDASTALFLGARASYDLRAGANLRVWRGERVQLSARVGGRRVRGLAVTPAELAVDLLDDTERALSRLVRGRWGDGLLTSESAWQGGVGLSAAWAVHEHWGVLGSVSARVGALRRSQRSRQVEGAAFQLGSGLVVDVRPSGGPVGLQLGLQDRVDRAPGLADALPARHRIAVPGQLYVDRGMVQLGLVPSVAAAWGGDVGETELGLEGRAVAYF